MQNINNKILELIHSKRESDYWDFKREPHSNNASLLHDIICLSNSLHKGEKYLIIGVADPVDNCEIIGLTNGQKNRKSQSNLIDFLREKPFAGGIRPEVEIETILINNLEIDIIKIKDNPFKPYYLTEDFRDRDKYVKANHIYTRIVDTNTPINKSADLYYIEKMWYQRFGLDLSPSERFKQLLKKPEEWFEDFGNTTYAYHKTFPEFRIEFSDPEEMWEPFCEFYDNTKGYFGKAIFKYQLNILFELTYIYCDEMRILLANPSTNYLRVADNEYWYYYYDLSTWDGIFLQFLRNKKMDFSSRGLGAPFLIFENSKEVKKFHNYLKENKDIIDSVQPDFVPKPQEYRSVVNLEFLCKAKMIFDRKAYT
jgi:hypothetical protein